MKWLMIGVPAAVLAAGIGFVVIDQDRKQEKPERQELSERQEGTAMTTPKVREPAVAGLFYPADAAVLARTIDNLLAAAKPEPLDGELKALICPHAGYEYSGPTAAFSYKLLQGRDVDCVILLAPSHHALFEGASVCDADVYRTPLGDVPVSEKAKTLATLRPFVPEPRVPLRRPAWSGQSSHALPSPGADTPETWEHSGEVQVPFLQKVLKNFKLLPVVFGDTDPEQAARALAGMLDGRTVVIASSDLSHYHPHDEAKTLDSRCVAAICNLDTEQIKSQEACGLLPVRTLMHLAKLKGWQARLLDMRNSGDVTGDKSRGVVGYAAIAFCAPASQSYSTDERKLLLELARKTIRGIVMEGRAPTVDPGVMPPKFTARKGCFVTLTKDGGLRGCIGHLGAQMPLYQAIMDNARSAATRDPRFQPVRTDELAEIAIEISVLTEPQALEFGSPDDLLDKLRPDKDGVVLQIADRSATYLPQVWEHFPKKEDFLNTLAQKAGCPPDAWRGTDTKVFTYQVEAFKESEP
jgi:hypothetical protein